MDRTRVAAVAVVGAGATGIVLLFVAAVTVFSSFEIKATDFQRPTRPRLYDCGSVWQPEDPRNLTPPRSLNVPRQLQTAHGRCQQERSARTRRATLEMIAGAALVIGALGVPAANRRLRRRRTRRKRPYTV